MATAILLAMSILMLYGMKYYVVLKYGIQDSWSEVFFTLKNNENKGWLWQLMMVLNAFIMGAVFFELTEGYNYQFLGVFTAFPIAFVGVAPDFKTKHLTERMVHVVAALISALGSLAIVICVSITIDLTIVFVVPIFMIISIYNFYRKDMKNLTWHAEFACFDWTYAVYILLLIEYFKKL